MRALTLLVGAALASGACVLEHDLRSDDDAQPTADAGRAPAGDAGPEGAAACVDAGRDGLPCDDGIACTIDDTCLGGACIGAARLDDPGACGCALDCGETCAACCASTCIDCSCGPCPTCVQACNGDACSFDCTAGATCAWSAASSTTSASCASSACALEHRPTDAASRATFTCTNESDCRIDASGAGALDVTCANDARCSVASTGVAVAVVCDSGATAVLAIDAAADVRVADASATGTLAAGTARCEASTCALTCTGPAPCVLVCAGDSACDFACDGATSESDCSGASATALACNATCPAL